MAKPQNGVYLILDTPTYSIAETSRLVGLGANRVRRWLQGYEYRYKIDRGIESREGRQDAVVKRIGTRETTYASFLDLIDLLFVKKFLEFGFSLQRVRKALDDARYILGEEHFARNIFFADGKDIFIQVSNIDNGILKLMSGGQWAIAPIIKQLAEKIDFNEVTGLATRWYPLGKEGLIVVDPHISFGKPSIIGRRIATENIYNLYMGENEKVASVSRWLGIPGKEVRAAVKFEYSLAA